MDETRWVRSATYHMRRDYPRARPSIPLLCGQRKEESGLRWPQSIMIMTREYNDDT